MSDATGHVTKVRIVTTRPETGAGKRCVVTCHGVTFTVEWVLTTGDDRERGVWLASIVESGTDARMVFGIGMTKDSAFVEAARSAVDASVLAGTDWDAVARTLRRVGLFA